MLFDDNSISIDGPTSLAVSDDQPARFQAAGWSTVWVDGHDPAAIAVAIECARRSDRPTLIACKTIIGYGAPNKAGKASTHGEPLGADEIKGARDKLGWMSAPFEVPAEVLAAWRAAGARGFDQRKAWEQRAAKLDASKRASLADPMDAGRAQGACRGRRLPSKPSSRQPRPRSPRALPRRRCWRRSCPPCRS